MCEFCTKIPAFYRRLWLAAPLFRSYFADIQGEKIFSQISSLRKLRSISKIGVDSFVYFTVDEQRKGKKTEWDVSLSCTFLLELFCLLFKPGILLKFIHFLQLYIQNKKLTLFVIPGLPNILTLIIFCTLRFYEYTWFFGHFAVCSGMDNRKTGQETYVTRTDFLSPSLIGCFVLQDGVGWFHHSGNSVWRNDGENVGQTSRKVGFVCLHFFLFRIFYC